MQSPQAPCWAQCLKLKDFRSYESLSLTFGPEPIVLQGPNGAGKTNILEALSLFAPGRGLRKAKLKTLARFQDVPTPWSLFAEFNRTGDTLSIGTGLDGEKERRLIKINGAPQPQAALTEWLSILWQTPQSDQLFMGSMGERRRFFDALIGHLTPHYTKHLYRYDYALRERSKLLKEPHSDPQWISILEETLSQEAVILCAERKEFFLKLNDHGTQALTNFPKFRVESQGLIESWLEEKSALEVEERIQKTLKENRKTDALTGGSKIGAHQSEILVINLDSKRPAEVCSTGEQKALLLSLMMANCRYHAVFTGIAPILLLDEVVAHLDKGRREKLFEEILGLKVQAWLTGTDARVFEPLQGSARFLSVDQSTVKEG